MLNPVAARIRFLEGPSKSISEKNHHSHFIIYINSFVISLCSSVLGDLLYHGKNLIYCCYRVKRKVKLRANFLISM